MEFEEEHEHEEAEEEMGIPVPPPPPPPFDSSRSKMGGSAIGGEGGASTMAGSRKSGSTGSVRYRECQKNHAVSIGGHAVDGCGEFLAAGEEGSLDALKCAACNCHRNFHRKEIEGEMSSYHQLPPPPQAHHHHQFPAYYRGPAAGYFHHHLTSGGMGHQRPLALPAAASGGGGSREEEDMSNPSSSGGGGGGFGSGRKKRFRTKFTQEQKEKMLAFSERVGWRIQKHDEGAVEQFCAETGVKRQVLKESGLSLQNASFADDRYKTPITGPAEVDRDSKTLTLDGRGGWVDGGRRYVGIRFLGHASGSIAGNRGTHFGGGRSIDWWLGHGNGSPIFRRWSHIAGFEFGIWSVIGGVRIFGFCFRWLGGVCLITAHVSSLPFPIRFSLLRDLTLTPKS
ncbi:zinc-finger homeodomain protein 2-like [Senna tora]|uniref:Zinc-finger homeodomain protein 2-like n=1 Tax=Senna tora TaxID=362788 RepID=A0A834T846_9FABA|nr:zinc-finger homeodomain protein 2-like [Senna tora]